MARPAETPTSRARRLTPPPPTHTPTHPPMHGGAPVGAPVRVLRPIQDCDGMVITAGRLGPTRHGRHGWACGMVARSGLAARPTDTTNRPAGGGRSGLGRRHRLGTGRGVRATGGPCRLGPGASRDPARGRPAHADRPRGASQQLITSLTNNDTGQPPQPKGTSRQPPPPAGVRRLPPGRAHAPAAGRRAV